MEQETYRLGCDIGGTFTDFVLVNDRTGQFYTNKCLTTPSDPSDAVEKGIRELGQIKPGFMDNVQEIIHGTTLVINAIIERKGAATGLLTTKGFKDVLELGREIRYDAYDIFSEYPQPIVPRALRMEIDERVTADGIVLRDVDEEQTKQVLNLLKNKNIESIAVCFINSYENPVNEKKVKEVTKKIKKGEFNFNDFLEQLNMMSKLGSMKSIISMIPGMSQMGNAIKDMDLENSSEVKKIKAMISSMTPKERKEPNLLLKTNTRKRRIANGAGLSIQETNKILKQFQMAAKMAKKFANKKGMPNMNELMKQMGNMKFPH